MTLFRKHRTPIAAPLLALFLWTFLPTALMAEDGDSLEIEGFPTNLGLADMMSRQVADEAVTALEGWLGDTVGVVAGKESSGNPLVLLALKESLRKAGHRPMGAEDGADKLLEFRILDMRISYTGVDRRALGLKKEVERAGACVLALSVIDAESGEELSSTQQEVLLADHFPKHLLELVASKSYTFTNPELNEKEWSKSVEPWVVGGLVASLAWLFYSNQSSE
jgi:hypothetical protein